jgi:hypothetical protein
MAKNRKGRKLSADDIAHYQKIVVALNETIRLMAEIDKTIAAHGGGQVSYEFGGRSSLWLKQNAVLIYVNPRLKSLYFLYTLWPQNPTNKTPKDHLFSPLLSFTLPRLSPFVLRSSSLVSRPSSVLHRPSSFTLRPSLFVPTPKVKKCKKSVQNMLKTRSFLLIFVQNARVFVNFLSIFAHFHPHF